MSVTLGGGGGRASQWVTRNHCRGGSGLGEVREQCEKALAEAARHQFDNARALAEDALQRAADPLSAAKARGVLGYIELSAGNYHAARQHLEQVVWEVPETEPEYPRYCGCLAYAYRKLGETERSAPWYQKYLDLSQDQGNREQVALAAWGLGLNYLQRREYEKAVAHLASAVDHYRQLGLGRNEGACARAGALAHVRLGHLREAKDLIDRALTLHNAQDDVKERAMTHTEAARIALALHDLGGYGWHARRAMVLCAEAGLPSDMARLLMFEGAARLAMGDPFIGASYLKEAWISLDRYGAREEIPECQRLLEECERRQKEVR